MKKLLCKLFGHKIKLSYFRGLYTCILISDCERCGKNLGKVETPII